MFFNVLIIILGGFGAGVVTGLAGASAATIITPLLITFTPIPAYIAITIALLTDVCASAVSAITYKKNGNIDMSKGIWLSVFAVIGSIIGSYLSAYVNGSSLGAISAISTLLIGINFFSKSQLKRKAYFDKSFVLPEIKPKFENRPILASGFLGMLIGLVCGIVGAGGGLMILLILTSVLAYDTKTAVGTSVLIMTFTALFGGLAHVYKILETGAYTDVIPVFIIGVFVSSIFAIIGAKVAAKFANAAEEYIMLLIVSCTFIVLSSVSIIAKII
ncbi:MAG: sulfite exporter TauE/SafE family protein [Lachnospirales bacterium]